MWKSIVWYWQMIRLSRDWREDSMREHGRVLTGKYAHWCPDWDFLTMDETCSEWPCICASHLTRK